MALTIEDGSIVANANSYVTDTEYTTYAADRGLTIGTDAAAREIELIKAMDYLESFEYQAYRSDPDIQLFNFPRRNVYANGRYIDSDEIPREIKSAQIEAAIFANTGDLQINETLQNIQKEKIDVLEVSYFSRGKPTTIRVSSVMRYLEPFLLDTSALVRV